MLISELIDEIMSHVRPPDEIGLDTSLVMTYINSATRDARNAGWLIHMEDDESLTALQNTWEYAVPATFAYVHEIKVENNTTSPSTWDEVIPEGYWDISINGGVPYFFFITPFMLPVGLKFKVIGQRRPTIYAAVGETIDAGMESLLREWAIVYSLGFIRSTAKDIWGEPDEGIDGQRFAIWDRRRRTAELMLRQHPQEFRVRPDSHLVKGR